PGGAPAHRGQCPGRTGVRGQPHPAGAARRARRAPDRRRAAARHRRTCPAHRRHRTAGRIGRSTPEGRPMIATGILLAAVAACLYGVAAALQHQVVHTVARDTGRLSLAHIGELLRRGRWLLGWAAEIVAAVVHVMSLSLAPLSVVQPVGVIAIGLAAVLSARLSGVPVGRSTWVAVLVTAMGVGLFLLSAAPHAGAAPVPEMAAGRVLPAAGLVGGALVLAAVVVRGRARCPLFATAAGVAFGTVSVLTRVVAERI